MYTFGICGDFAAAFRPQIYSPREHFPKFRSLLLFLELRDTL
jgi:hypothetical protein